MAVNKKPLHPYEQSMLLTALLFDAKNLPELLAFLPDEQHERIKVAESKFFTLSRNERITQIVLELRRLLLIDENRIDWIHKTWIDDALAKEPPYLRSIIKKALAEKATKPTKASSPNETKLPLSLIVKAFVLQLTKTPQKIAHFDPLLMRLQNQNEESQNELFLAIGRLSIEALGQKIDGKRLLSYLKRKGYKKGFTKEAHHMDINPFSHDDLRRHYLRELIRFKPRDEANCAVFAGLLTMSLYLLTYKNPWQRTFALGLHINLGRLLETLIKRAEPLQVLGFDRAQFSRILLLALDELKL